MRTILRHTAFNAFSLFLLPQFLSGVKIAGGLPTYIIGGFVLALIFIFVKPILSLISLPLNIMTLGLFSFLSNVVLIYILTVLVPAISIRSFNYTGGSNAGFVIPKMHVNAFFAYLVAAMVLSLIDIFLSWVTKK